MHSVNLTSPGEKFYYHRHDKCPKTENFCHFLVPEVIVSVEVKCFVAAELKMFFYLNLPM